jgi:hypothetical protein
MATSAGMGKFSGLDGRWYYGVQAGVPRAPYTACAKQPYGYRKIRPMRLIRRPFVKQEVILFAQKYA